MSAELSNFLVLLLALLAYAVAGLLVLLRLDESPRCRHYTRRWTVATEWWALGFWPLSVLWVLWRCRRHA